MKKNDKIVAIGKSSYIPYEIVFNILIKVPAMSLLRFKCVSKSFRSLISQPLFIEAHQKGSKAQLIVRSVDLRDGHGAVIYNLEHKEHQDMDYSPFHYLNEPCLRYLERSRSANGLVCLWNHLGGAVAICNPFTKEHVFLPKFTEEAYGILVGITCYCLGFDATTKKHKVLKAEIVMDEKKDKKVKYWIFSIGVDKYWRKINGHPEFFPGNSVHIGGVIYHPDVTLHRVVAFNVKDENFRDILFPYEISNFVFSPMVEIKGQVAVLDHGRVRYDGKIFMYVLNDGQSSETWVKHTIELPTEFKHLLHTADSFRFTSNPGGEIVVYRPSTILPVLFYDIGKKQWKTVDLNEYERVDGVTRTRVVLNLVESIWSVR